jgi:hypothetical protein
VLQPALPVIVATLMVVVGAGVAVSDCWWSCCGGVVVMQCVCVGGVVVMQCVCDVYVLMYVLCVSA